MGMNLQSCETEYSVMRSAVKLYQILLEEQSINKSAIAASKILEIKAKIEWEEVRNWTYLAK